MDGAVALIVVLAVVLMLVGLALLARKRRTGRILIARAPNAKRRTVKR